MTNAKLDARLEQCKRSWKTGNKFRSNSTQVSKATAQLSLNEELTRIDRSTTCFRRVGSRYRTTDLSKRRTPEKVKNKAIASGHASNRYYSYLPV
jgi:hypothetical protein